tara:strand:- start:329 stop:1048 length:720 start_codon:yes stop_codon:yes gene_type:complete
MSIITLNTRSLPDSAVTTAKIAADAITDAKVADDIIGTEHLTAGEVDATALGANAVTAAKLNNDIVSGLTALGAEPADTDEFLVSDAGTIKRLDYSYIKGGGKVLQVVNVSTESQVATTSTSYTAVSGMTLNITPSASSSKILLIHSANVQAGAGFYGYYTIYRDSTDISESHADRGLGSLYSSQGTQALPMHFSKLDSPSTTSQITYTVQFKSSNGTAMHYGEPDGTTTSLIAIEIGA